MKKQESPKSCSTGQLARPVGFDERAEWERPQLKRLGMSEAETLFVGLTPDGFLVS